MHGACGVLGALYVGIFHEEKGMVAGELELLRIQILGIISIISWTVSLTYITCKFIDKTIKLRVTDKQEDKGLDIVEHGCLTSSLAFYEVTQYKTFLFFFLHSQCV